MFAIEISIKLCYSNIAVFCYLSLGSVVAMKNKNHPQRVKKTTASRSALLARKESKSIAVILLVFFLCSALFRYILSVRTVNMPTVYIDEGLYVNIARSLFYDGQVMYRDQPISYVYLLYPIFLLPVFLLSSSVSLYRAIQFYNALLISSSVFPAYFLGKKVGLSVERSILLAFLTLLIPELSLSSFLTAESLYYPMMIWLFVLTADLCNGPSGKKAVAEYLVYGLASGILYFAKPICLIFPCCLIVTDLVLSLRRKDFKGTAIALLGAAAVGLVILGGYFLYNLLFGKATVLNLYEKQLSDTALSSVPIMVQAFFYHIIALVFACGGAWVLLPFLQQRRFSPARQHLALVCLLGVLASILGISIMIVPYNYTGSGLTCPVHLRYLMFFFPLLFSLFLAWDPPKGKISFVSAGILILVTFLTVFPGAFHFFNDQAGTFDAPSLNAFYSNRANPVCGVLLTIISAGGTLFFTYHSARKRYHHFCTTAVCLILILFFFTNGIYVYANRRTSDATVERDATLVSAAIAEEEDALIVTTNLYDDFRAFSLDSHLHKPLQMVVMNDMLLNCTQTGGVYQSWTPLVQAPNTANNPTVQTDTLLFDLTTSDYVEFTDQVLTRKIGDYLIAKITDASAPFLKSAIASMDGFTLHKQDLGSLLVFDPDILSRGSVTMDIVMRSANGTPCTVTFSCCGEQQQVSLTSTWESYSITLPIQACDFFHFTISCTQDIEIGQYKTQ